MKSIFLVLCIVVATFVTAYSSETSQFTGHDSVQSYDSALSDDFMEDPISVLSAPKYTAEDFITGVAFTNDKCKEGFQKVSGDLNKGAGGDYIYMCIKKGGSEEPLLDMQVVTGDDSMDIGACPRGYNIIDQDE